MPSRRYPPPRAKSSERRAAAGVSVSTYVARSKPLPARTRAASRSCRPDGDAVLRDRVRRPHVQLVVGEPTKDLREEAGPVLGIDDRDVTLFLDLEPGCLECLARGRRVRRNDAEGALSVLA